MNKYIIENGNKVIVNENVDSLICNGSIWEILFEPFLLTDGTLSNLVLIRLDKNMNRLSISYDNMVGLSVNEFNNLVNKGLFKIVQ